MTILDLLCLFMHARNFNMPSLGEWLSAEHRSFISSVQRPADSMRCPPFAYLSVFNNGVLAKCMADSSSTRVLAFAWFSHGYALTDTRRWFEKLLNILRTANGNLIERLKNEAGLFIASWIQWIVLKRRYLLDAWDPSDIYWKQEVGTRSGEPMRCAGYDWLQPGVFAARYGSVVLVYWFTIRFRCYRGSVWDTDPWNGYIITATHSGIGTHETYCFFWNHVGSAVYCRTLFGFHSHIEYRNVAPWRFLEYLLHEITACRVILQAILRSLISKTTLFRYTPDYVPLE